MERLIQIIFLILVNISVAACSSADYNNGEISDKEIAEIISRTTPVYNEYCSGCHESDIKEFSNGNFIHGKNPESIYQSIAEGRNSGEMPSFKDAFSDAQIKDMVITILHSANTLDNFDLKLSGTDSEVYESRHFNFKLKKVIDEISSPWGMAFLPEGGFLVTDKSGELYRVNKLNQKIKIKGFFSKTHIVIKFHRSIVKDSCIIGNIHMAIHITHLCNYFDWIARVWKFFFHNLKLFLFSFIFFT